MLYRLTETEPFYDLENPKERIYLRDDLERKGFFDLIGNEHYYSWFEIEKLSRDMFADLYKAMQLFAHTLLPKPVEPN